MEKFFYEEPSLERKKDAIEYIEEHLEYNSAINGSGGLNKYVNNYEEWLQKLETYRTMSPTEEKVPALTYFLIRENDNKIIGMVNIRLTLNERLKHSGGHIGYGIRPTERRKGYNKMNLYLALEVCQQHGIEQAMLTCDKSNLGSSKTMQALGGKLQREFVEENGKIEQVYYIDVDDSLEKYRDIYATQKGKKK